jgi:hypothetical protein
VTQAIAEGGYIMRKIHAVNLLVVVASLTLALGGGAWAVEYLPDKEGVAEA